MLHRLIQKDDWSLQVQEYDHHCLFEPKKPTDLVFFKSGTLNLLHRIEQEIQFSIDALHRVQILYVQ